MGVTSGYEINDSIADVSELFESKGNWRIDD